MNKDFTQLEWSPRIAADCRQIVRLAVLEDLDREHDWTTLALAPQGVQAAANIVVRQPGVVAGLLAAHVALEEMDAAAELQMLAPDGAFVQPGTILARLNGAARDLLTCERIVLNLLGRLSGIATLTHQFVQLVAGSPARIYDTRKTTPGWRRLEKYAVHCGGGRNHRGGLYDGVLIKDNHLAFGAQAGSPRKFTPREAVEQARRFVQEQAPHLALILEVEVDNLEQLADVLPANPDIVLLDNMPLGQLREAVRLRNQAGSAAELEASGGVNLQTVGDIARTGVERISVGALTHSAVCLDIGLDWTC